MTFVTAPRFAPNVPAELRAKRPEPSSQLRHPPSPKFGLGGWLDQPVAQSAYRLTCVRKATCRLQNRLLAQPPLKNLYHFTPGLFSGKAPKLKNPGSSESGLKPEQQLNRNAFAPVPGDQQRQAQHDRVGEHNQEHLFTTDDVWEKAEVNAISGGGHQPNG